MKVGNVFIVLVLAPILLHQSNGHRILTILSLAGKSNMNYFDVINLELAKKGHEIVVVSPTTPSVHHENIQVIPVLDFSNIVKGLVQSGGDFFQMRLAGDRMGSPFVTFADKFASDCDTFHQTPAVQKILSGEAGKFDLVMTMAFMNECVYGIINQLNASSIIISTVPAMPWYVEITGTPTLLSFVPHIYWPGSEEMGFLERVGNFGSYLYQIVTRNYLFLPKIESVYRKYIPNAPSILEVKKNVSLVMGAGHLSFGPMRPAMPDLIDDIGGIHCSPPKPLPKEIQQMITNSAGEATDFIFFSLGSIVQGHQVPGYLRKAFLNTFAKLEGQYTVLWKWEAELGEGEELPPNVKISKWFPQQDVLGHPKCKLFITHGGLSSLHESIYHGVPVIGIPFFGDQDWNMKQVEYAKIGMKLELSDISEKYFGDVVDNVLHDPTFRTEMKRRSEIFRDRQNSAKERAVWWVEYVLRHQGATHLRSPARDMNILQFYSVDIILFICACLLASFFVMYSIFRKVVGSNPQGKDKLKSS